ncbi:MAG: type I methionyl aminopeptidase [bacterium]|nr:type I methionyl aminopeptidase [bacterium]MDZ4284633.1 type I methionyl aminopeptidase [Patescibacteria group bacterium]
MSLIKTPEEIALMRAAGKRLAFVLHEVTTAALPGVSARELDSSAERLIRAGGDRPAFLDYTPGGARRPYPATLCVSVNDEVVHGIPNEREKILREGDIVGFDLGLEHGGFFADMAVTIGVGGIDEPGRRLIEATRGALDAGIAVARAGSHIGDIGFAVARFVRKGGFGLVTELGGHSIGRSLHELPFVPNSATRGSGALLASGMTICIEPMLCEGSGAVRLDSDGYTFRTRDGRRSAHFEHTILITDGGAEILTAP